MTLGVHSEVGRLRRVMVHRPGLEHSRLTPSNAEDLLFDDVLWVARAKAEHDMFVEAMRDHRIEVFHTEKLLAEALAQPGAGTGSPAISSTSARSASPPRSGPANGPRRRMRRWWRSS